MLDVYEIPLSKGAQQFSCKLGNDTYKLRLMWRTANEGGWILDILEETTEEPVIAGILVSLGNDLLSPYQHMGLGHLVALLDSKTVGYPTYDDMGDLLKLYWRGDE